MEFANECFAEHKCYRLYLTGDVGAHAPGTKEEGLTNLVEHYICAID